MNTHGSTPCAYCDASLVTECGRTWCPNPDCPGNVGNPRPSTPKKHPRYPSDEVIAKAREMAKDTCVDLNPPTIAVALLDTLDIVDELLEKIDSQFVHVAHRHLVEIVRLVRNQCAERISNHDGAQSDVYRLNPRVLLAAACVRIDAALPSKGQSEADPDGTVALVRAVRDVCAEAVAGRRYSENSCDAPADVRALDPDDLLASARARLENDPDEEWRQLDQLCKQATGFRACEITMPLLAAEHDPYGDAGEPSTAVRVLAKLFGSAEHPNTQAAASAILGALEKEGFMVVASGGVPPQPIDVEQVAHVRDICADVASKIEERAGAEVAALGPSDLMLESAVRLGEPRGNQGHASESARDQRERERADGRIHLEVKCGVKREDVRFLLDAVKTCWPNMVVFDDAGWIRGIYMREEIRKDLFVYRDPATYEAWTSQGPTSENAGDWLHFRFDATQMTVSVAPASPVAKTLCAALDGAENGGPWQAELRRLLDPSPDPQGDPDPTVPSGEDIVIPRPATDDDIRFWMGVLRDQWPDMVVSDTGFDTFVYRDRAAVRSWNENGRTDENDGSMVHFLFDQEQTTIVVEPGSEIAGALHAALEVDDCAAGVDPARIEALEFEPCGHCRACIAGAAEVEGAGVIGVTRVTQDEPVVDAAACSHPNPWPRGLGHEGGTIYWCRDCGCITEMSGDNRSPEAWMWIRPKSAMPRVFGQPEHQKKAGWAADPFGQLERLADYCNAVDMLDEHSNDVPIVDAVIAVLESYQKLLTQVAPEPVSPLPFVQRLCASPAKRWDDLVSATINSAPKDLNRKQICVVGHADDGRSGVAIMSEYPGDDLLEAARQLVWILEQESDRE